MEELQFYWEKRRKKSSEIRIEVPGFKKDEISAKFLRGSIVVSASKMMRQEKKGKDFFQKEHFSRSFSTTLPLPPDINPSLFSLETVDDAVIMKPKQK